MGGWSTVALAAIIVAGAFFVWRKISRAAKNEERLKAHKASDKARDDQDAKNDKFRDLDDDDDLTERMRAVREAGADTDTD